MDLRRWQKTPDALTRGLRFLLATWITTSTMVSAGGSKVHALGECPLMR